MDEDTPQPGLEPQDAAGEQVEPEAEYRGEPLTGVKQAARALGLTTSHVYAQLRSGRIRAVDVPANSSGGTRRMIPIAEIERIIAERGPAKRGEVKATPPEDERPLLQLEVTTQRLQSTRAVLTGAVEQLTDTSGMGWWARRRAERENAVKLEAALRAAIAASGGVEQMAMSDLAAEQTYISDDAEAALRAQAIAEIDAQEPRLARGRAEMDELLEMTERPPRPPEGLPY